MKGSSYWGTDFRRRLLQFEKIALEVGQHEGEGSGLTKEDVKDLYLTQICMGIGVLVTSLNVSLDLGTGSILHNILFTQLKDELQDKELAHEAALDITKRTLAAVDEMFSKLDGEDDEDKDLLF